MNSYIKLMPAEPTLDVIVAIRYVRQTSFPSFLLITSS